MISQGRIGALVTAKPTDRRAILEEAAGIAGIHVRRHESELRLNSAENNLKRADELRRQQEKQLENLKKQAVEASKYKSISEDIKKIEAGLYYIKLIEIFFFFETIFLFFYLETHQNNQHQKLIWIQHLTYSVYQKILSNEKKTCLNHLLVISNFSLCY